MNNENMKNAEDFLKECKKDKNFRMSTDTVSDEILISFATGYANFKFKNLGAIGDVSDAQKLEKLASEANASSCHAVFDEDENIVQLYQTEEKANKGLWDFQNSHPHTEFYVDTMQIN